MSTPPGSCRVLREPRSGELREKGSRFLVKHLVRAHAAEGLAESYGVDVEVALRMRADAEEAVRWALTDRCAEVVSETEDDS